jgi:glycosyltransferase involved in cell wall biosynthesis
VFVLASHGEGWGRPIAEAMAMEVPVIATNWSGQTDYMNSKNRWLVLY